ncbi:hypothetical protein SFC79_11290 [Nocardioides sp. S-58]|uniref:ANTAR domain-containing protein n=1 Tax=Nocardioides renjunii TaxID=3095075 RepID=A0ABU5KD32_9ACTN|nr:hypothetical protein [Nocardioides sp. S-58]MDZ5662349.1 hypothetical protein [Nocardioides sp. S-58]
MDAERRADLEGIAAIAISACQMGKPDHEVEQAVRHTAHAVGRATREDLARVAEAIRQFPQPDDLSSDERERRRPIDEMVGLASAEEELEALLRAREVVLRIADTL